MSLTNVLFFLIGVGSFATRYLFLRKIFGHIRNRELLIYLILLSSALGYIYAEVFSLFDGIGFLSARIYWLTLSIVETVILIQHIKRKPAYWKDTVRGLRQKLHVLITSQYGVTIAICTILIVIPLFLLAVFTPPNNFDSNNYHLHRLLAWTHFGNVDFYPTTHVQQLYHNVFAEYLVLNVYLFTGTDYFVNLVQFFGGLACISTLSLLGEQLGLNRRGQLIACLTMLTLPVAVFEMTTTQVDLLSTFYFTGFLFFAYSLREKYQVLHIVGLSASLAFAAAAKYPLFFYAFPFSLYFAVVYLKKYGFKKAAIIGLTAGLFLALTFFPFWKRNYDLFGHILSPPVGTEFFAEKIPADDHRPVLTLSNLIKNASLHLGMPYTGYNLAVEKGVQKIHDLIGVDVNQPEISHDHFAVRYSVHEDMVPNTIHFYLLVILTVLLFFTQKDRDLRLFWLMALAGMVVFVTLLKFQLWCTRTHIPFFAMGSIVIASFLQETSRLIRITVLTAMTVLASLFVFGNPSKPLIPLPYFTKKAFAHIPLDICPDSTERDRYQTELTEYYDFNTDDCYRLKAFPGRDTRKTVFSMLDELEYYDPIKLSVFNQSRADLYFVNFREKYESYKPLLKHFQGSRPGVAVLSMNGDGFYFFQKALLADRGIDADFRYVLSKKEYDVLKNTHKPFRYQYILTDDLTLVKNYVDIGQAEVIESGRYALIILDREMDGLFVY